MTKLRFLLTLILVFGFGFGHLVEAATAPYPRSKVISDITFRWTTLKQAAPGSDNWPITWAADGHQYTSWGDGGGFGGTNTDGRVSLGVARVEGTKDSHKGYNRWGGKNAQYPAQFGGKSYGIISIGGVLYMWVSPGSDTQNYSETRLAKSTDRGAHWTRSSWKFTKSQNLMIPTILQFGKDYAGARDSYVYHYFIQPSPTSSTSLSIQKPGKIYLARVPKSQMMTQSAYQFLSGFDSNRNPKWSSSISSKVPVFQDRYNGVGWTLSVSYNPGLKRYLLITEHTQTYPKGGNIGIYDAPTPWGPWTTAYFKTPWAGTTSKCFFWNFANKWLSSDGKNFVMVFTGQDKYNAVQGTFKLATTSTLTTMSTGDSTADPDAEPEQGGTGGESGNPVTAPPMAGNSGSGTDSEDRASLPGTSAVFPVRLSSKDGSMGQAFVGVAILNDSTGGSSVETSAVDQDGTEQMVDTSVLEAGGQRSFLAERMAAEYPDAVSLRVHGKDDKLRTLFMVGDGRPDRLDGVGAALSASKRLFFPVAQVGATEKTFLFLSNPQPTKQAKLSLEVTTSHGEIVRTADLELAPGASRLAELSEVLDTSDLQGEHYLKVASDLPVQGFELLVDRDAFSSAAGRDTNTVQTMWVPHFLLGPDGEETELRLVNAEAAAVQASLRVYDDQAVLMTTRQLTIPAGGLSVTRLSEMLSPVDVSGEASVLTGHMVLEVERPARLLGTVTFAGRNGEAKSTLPVLHQPEKESLYLHIAQSPEEKTFTGLAVMNPTGRRASLVVQAFAENGQMTAEQTVEVAPGHRLVDLLNGSRLFGPDFQQTGGHLRVTSDEPVVSFVIFGDGESRFLAAVEGQAPAK